MTALLIFGYIAALLLTRIFRSEERLRELTSGAARRTMMFFAAVAAISAIVQIPIASSQTLPSDQEIRQILVDRVDVQHKSVGMVVGIVTPNGRRLIAYGHLNQGDPRELNGDTVFEIGSVTKVFTALLLSDMVQRGEVHLNDPVAKYLPAASPLPDADGRSITLVDLATQTSGLPFLPSDVPLNDVPKAIDVVAGYTPERVYQFLSTWHPTRAIGSKWEYSNLGFGVLGLALASRENTDYESLVRSRITGPLGMDSTGITISPRMKARLASGHDARLQPAPPSTCLRFWGPAASGLVPTIC
jgi:serine-type D-Ala-D-Ala carboxypeptidase/endopeptidase